MSPRARGTGSVFRPVTRGRQSPRWSYQTWDRRSRKVISKGGFHSEAAAEKALRTVLGRKDKGLPIGPQVDGTAFEDLARYVTDDYAVNRRRSATRLGQLLKRLARFFARTKAVDITPDRITAYVRERLDQGAASATVNRELAALKRGFVLAEDAGRVARRPRFKMLREDNVRAGFFERAEYERLLFAIDPPLKPVIRVAYVTGWRVPSEILTREWRHVDFKGGWLVLDPGEAKNREGRRFPLDPDLRAVLRAQRDAADALEREHKRITPTVFFEADGSPIRLFRKRWITACVRAGMGSEVRDAAGKLVSKTTDRLVHDFRRTAVRNLEVSGVPRSLAMKLVGHKTEAIYRRYAISTEADLRKAAVTLAKGRKGR